MAVNFNRVSIARQRHRRSAVAAFTRHLRAPLRIRCSGRSSSRHRGGGGALAAPAAAGGSRRRCRADAHARIDASALAGTVCAWHGHFLAGVEHAHLSLGTKTRDASRR